MGIIKIIVVLIAGLCASSGAWADFRDYPFHVENRPVGRDYELVAVNEGIAPVSVRVTITGENFITDKPFPISAVIPPKSTMNLARVSGVIKGSAYRFSYTMNSSFGDLNAVPATNAVYRYPFADGLQFNIGQAHGGQITTHTTPNSIYAIDFNMPVGTPIVAARSGKLIDINHTFTFGAPDERLLDKANQITVLHDDGTMAQYVHLSKVLDQLVIGQKIHMGQLIGFSGNTGFSSGPHLHFGVTKAAIRPNGKLGLDSVPVTFYAHNPPVRITPQQGMTATADYTSPYKPGMQGIIRNTGTNQTGATRASIQ